MSRKAVILAGAHLLVSRRKQVGDFVSFMWPFGAVGLGMCGLVMIEGDLGTAIIIAGLLLDMLWIGGMRGRNWALVAVTGLATALTFTFTSSERTSRVLSFLDPSAEEMDPVRPLRDEDAGNVTPPGPPEGRDRGSGTRSLT